MQGLSFTKGRWRVLPAHEISLLRKCHAEPAAAAKHLGRGEALTPPLPRPFSSFRVTLERSWVDVAVHVDPTLAFV